MSFLCKLAGHKWDGCRCERCGEQRAHRWVGCRCEVCREKRDSDHDWNGCLCRKCQKVHPDNAKHDWGDSACRVCGTPLPDWMAAKRWAEALVAAGNYRALADLCCQYNFKSGDSNYYNKKRLALAALREADPSVAGQIVAALEAGENKEADVAAALCALGNPIAVPLLAKMFDRGAWSYSHEEHVRRSVKAFIDRFPQARGEPEQVTCSICGKTGPASAAKCVGEHCFCSDACWRRRGRVMTHGVQPGCPHYDEGVCAPRGRDTGLCSMQGGSYAGCHVLAVNPG